jgi:hypothetical protein
MRADRDNPKLPGAPHPDDVAARAAKARKEAKLPSRKQRAENERKAKAARTSAAANVQGTKLPDISPDRAQREIDRRRVNSKDQHGDVPAGLRHLVGKEGDSDVKNIPTDTLQELVEKDREDRQARRNKSPMPGVLRSPAEADEKRAAQAGKKHVPWSERRPFTATFEEDSKGKGWQIRDKDNKPVGERMGSDGDMKATLNEMNGRDAHDHGGGDGEPIEQARKNGLAPAAKSTRSGGSRAGEGKVPPSLAKVLGQREYDLYRRLMKQGYSSAEAMKAARKAKRGDLVTTPAGKGRVKRVRTHAGDQIYVTVEHVGKPDSTHHLKDVKLQERG